jgi:hypothetical protein
MEAANSSDTTPSKCRSCAQMAVKTYIHSRAAASASRERLNRLQNLSIGKSRGVVPLWSSVEGVPCEPPSTRTSIRIFSWSSSAHLLHCRLHKFFGVSTIYIVNRDDSEVEAVVKGFTDSPIPGFEPTIVLTPPRTAYVVGAVPCFPPVTEAEIAARETVLAFMSVS